MRRLNGWQRLWLVGFIPWVIVNFWAINNESPSWMLGYWEDFCRFSLGRARCS